MVLAVGQDAAGAGMIEAYMTLLGISVAAVCGIVYFIAADKFRFPVIPWLALWRNRAKIAITLTMAGGLLSALYVLQQSQPQFYDLRVQHRYDADITQVLIRIGEEERKFERVEFRSYRHAWRLSAPPQSMSVTWTDPDGLLRQTSTAPGSVIPRRYNKGQLNVIIEPSQEIITTFRFPK